MSTLSLAPGHRRRSRRPRHLARRCLAADGGLAALAHEQNDPPVLPVRQRYRRADEPATSWRRPRLRDASGPGTATGSCTRPRAGRGWGRSWPVGPGALRRLPLRVVAETTSPGVGRAVRRARSPAHLRRARMRHPSTRSHGFRRPEGVTVRPGTTRPGLFFTAYRFSFADRPGFPDPPRTSWVARCRRTRLPPGDVPGRARRGRHPGGLRDDHRVVSTRWGVLTALARRGLGAHLVVRRCGRGQEGCDQACSR